MLFEDILWWIWILPLAYLVFRFKRGHWILLVWAAVFLLGYRFGLRWVDWIRTMGSRDWVGLLDKTPITADAFRHGCAALFGLAATRVMQRFVLPFLPPSDPSPPSENE